MAIMQSRRSFVTNAAVGGAAGLGALSLYGGGKSLVAAEPPPEISTIRLSRFPGICIAPQPISATLLSASAK